MQIKEKQQCLRLHLVAVVWIEAGVEIKCVIVGRRSSSSSSGLLRSESGSWSLQHRSHHGGKPGQGSVLPPHKEIIQQLEGKNVGLEVCVIAQRSTVANFNVEKVSLWQIPKAKLAAVFRRASWLCCRRERWCYTTLIQRQATGLRLRFDLFINCSTFTSWNV